jgi:hypothetical protein
LWNACYNLAKERLLSEEIQIKDFLTIILSIVLFELETRSLILKKTTDWGIMIIKK